MSEAEDLNSTPRPPTSVRIGIDVGGTFTKGVAIDAASRELLARGRVPTTHSAQEGVVAGVLDVLSELLAQLKGADVTLVAHATTQATNALLEGDIAKVGILALGPLQEQDIIRKRTKQASIALSSSHRLEPAWAFVATDDPSTFEASVQEVIARWQQEGVQAAAVNQAFGVDDPSLERRAVQLAAELGMPATAGSDLSGVYGLELRASTSAVNASILPIMLRTAEYVEKALAAKLPKTPLLVVRGDGGAVDLQGLREGPIHTVVSGPAASLAGAILAHGVSDGIFFEVGGTSTNIGAIKGRRPVMKHMQIMDFATAVRAADIRIAGVAGGSLVRLKGKRIEQVGPRSAHISGLPYACFATQEELAGATLQRISPLPGDPEDYAVLETPSKKRYAITPTCAANALGVLPETDPGHAPPQSARIALGELAKALNATPEAAAAAVLEASAEGLIRTVRDLAKAYDLQSSKIYGGGGGANVLGPVVAKRLGMAYVSVPQGEIISSIGAALTLIRVERDCSVKINDPTIAEFLSREVEAQAVRLGASPARLQTEVHYLPSERLLRAIVVGAHPVDSHSHALDDDVLQSLALGALGNGAECRYRSEGLVIYQGEKRSRNPFKGKKTPIAVFDRHGARVLELPDAKLLTGSPDEVNLALQELLTGELAPSVYAITPRKLLDCSHLSNSRALQAFLQQTFRFDTRVALIIHP